MLALPCRLLLVAADEVAAAPFPGAHHHLLDLEGVVDHSEAARPRQYVFLDLLELADGHGQDVVAEPLGQLAPIGLRVPRT